MNMVMKVLLERSKWLSHVDQLEMLEDSKLLIDPADRDEKGKHKSKVTQKIARWCMPFSTMMKTRFPLMSVLRQASKLLMLSDMRWSLTLNSSRFGRLTKLYYQFRDEDIQERVFLQCLTPPIMWLPFRLLGVREVSSLECYGSYNERCFHIFYQMLAARDEQELAELKDFGIAEYLRYAPQC